MFGNLYSDTRIRIKTTIIAHCWAKQITTAEVYLAHCTIAAVWLEIISLLSSLIITNAKAALTLKTTATAKDNYCIIIKIFAQRDSTRRHTVTADGSVSFLCYV